jgi:hypothetical protein
LFVTGCHSKIHSCITETELANEFNSLEKLISHPEIQKWIIWKQKHPNFVGRKNKILKD